MNEWVGRLPAHLVRAGEDTAFEREFTDRLRESSTLAVRLAYSVLRRQEDAEEVAQEAFARAYLKFSQLRDRERFRAWLARMVWRLAIDRYRSDRRRLVRDHAAAGPLESAPGELDAIQRQRADLLWQAIDALPEKLRIVTVLAAMEGHGVNEVAALLNLPPGTVKSQLFDARKKLQEALQCLTR